MLDMDSNFSDFLWLEKLQTKYDSFDRNQIVIWSASSSNLLWVKQIENKAKT
jgi:hypothetical protein